MLIRKIVHPIAAKFPLDAPLVRRIPTRTCSREVSILILAARISMHEALGHVLIVVWRVDRIPGPIVALCIEQDHVVNVTVYDATLLRVAVRAATLPYKLRPETSRTENRIEEEL